MQGMRDDQQKKARRVSFHGEQAEEYLEHKSQELAAKQEELPDTPLFVLNIELHSLSISFGGMTARLRNIARLWITELVARIKRDIAEKELSC